MLECFLESAAPRIWALDSAARFTSFFPQSLMWLPASDIRVVFRLASMLVHVVRYAGAAQWEQVYGCGGRRRTRAQCRAPCWRLELLRSPGCFSHESKRWHLMASLLAVKSMRFRDRELACIWDLAREYDRCIPYGGSHCIDSFGFSSASESETLSLVNRLGCQSKT